jgi:hypothetical protein
VRAKPCSLGAPNAKVQALRRRSSVRLLPEPSRTRGDACKHVVNSSIHRVRLPEAPALTSRSPARFQRFQNGTSSPPSLRSASLPAAMIATGLHRPPPDPIVRPRTAERPRRRRSNLTASGRQSAQYALHRRGLPAPAASTLRNVPAGGRALELPPVTLSPAAASIWHGDKFYREDPPRRTMKATLRWMNPRLGLKPVDTMA